MIGCPNQSTPDEFHIVAFSASPAGQLSLFIVILLMYLLTILGNVTIITLVCAVTKLHTPMYFFLCNLSFLDVISTSSFTPKLLFITLTQNHKISFQGCITQLYLFVQCGLSVIFILTSMAYDRYVAICKPLQYYLIMSKALCITMAAISWLIGILNSVMHAILTSLLLFCISRDINNFFCELNSVLSISSSNIKSRKLLIAVEDVLVGFVPFLLIIISYIFIILNVLKIRSRHGRLKAFSSCTSHLFTVILFGGPSIFLYIKSEFGHGVGEDKLLSILFLIVVPMLNPLVYSLRNKDIRDATRVVGNLKKKIF
ncbi:PREDICTED: olfactory receptor 5V1-like [Nanorana parkeri]|uniref:olfactory receptor 5V1-like n=1 Tax=Nanorana parkeri TaxID=125878 RepID=UPI000854847F|nr:PREDICTED: olfactory receptor 5V1-like [Nanorana parkeri]